MTGMGKFCVFCGATPQVKTVEHIIPKWLIQETGDLNRTAFFGLDIVSKEPKLRQFAFSSFAFPACSGCNGAFSILESRAKRVLLELLAEKPLSCEDFDILLDWLDKVRVGLWLGYFYLNKNPAQIHPRFFIRSRIRTKDRFMIICRVKNRRPGINFFSTESPSFQYSPSCFGLLINDFGFFNASNDSLCSRRLGFPHITEAFYTDLDGRIECSLEEGQERTRMPVVRNAFLPFGVRLYQPIFKEYMKQRDAQKYYDTPYAKKHCLEWTNGIGSVFVETGGSVQKYPETKSKLWMPEKAYELREFIPKIEAAVYDYQLDIFLNTASFEKLTERDRKWVKEHVKHMKQINGVLKKVTAEQMKKL